MTARTFINGKDAITVWSNWQAEGTWTVSGSGNASPINVSITPSSGTGSTQTFSFVFSDADGYTDLSTVYMLVNPTLNWPSSCHLNYDRPANRLWLLNDGATVWLGPLRPGIAGTVHNTVCGLDGKGSFASESVNNLTVGLALTFKAEFSRGK
jgi:hypothetical protein